MKKIITLMLLAAAVSPLSASFPGCTTGAAQLIHDDNYRARKRIKLQCRMIPHLDISDTIKASFVQDPLKEDYVFGDPLQKFGTGIFGETASSSLILYQKLLKVVGIVQRFTDQVTELTTEEIL